MNGKNDPQEERSKIYHLAIEIIFSVIIGVSFYNYVNVLVPFSFTFEEATILVTYATVLASLVGYSITITTKKYHKNVWRFIIDIVILYFYFQLLYSPQHSFDYFLAMYPWIFGLYMFWDFLAAKEWKESFRQKVKNSGPFFASFLAIWISYQFVPNKIQVISQETSKLEYGQVDYISWIILLAIFVLVILYRLFYWKFVEK